MKKIKKYLKKHLTKERYHHTVGVAYTAMSMAMKYNPQPDNNEFMIKAEIAGLLHDCAKCMDNDKKIRICNKNQISYSKIEAENPYLLHGKVGAYIARKEFDILDEDILNAIRYHTTGRAGMSLLEKIIFIADYIEPNREKFDGLEEARRLAYLDLDMAMKYILESTIAFVKERGRLLHPLSLEALEYYKHCVEKEETE